MLTAFEYSNINCVPYLVTLELHLCNLTHAACSLHSLLVDENVTVTMVSLVYCYTSNLVFKFNFGTYHTWWETWWLFVSDLGPEGQDFGS